MKAIPKRLLIHNAELINEYGDEWEVTKRTSTPLENVRIEASHSNIFDVKSQQITLSAVLFFDCKNSRCSLPFMLEGETSEGRKLLAQRVRFDGRIYTVKTIEPIYDDRRLHHYEVGLC